MTTLQPVVRGTLVVVVGPSGAGKDSVLNWLVQHWQGATPLYRARRTITRAPEPDGEGHESVGADEFELLRSSEQFAWHWAAHGLQYGVRHTELAGLHTGKLVMVNGSRGHLAMATARFPEMAVLHITASESTLTQRLLARQRESAEDIHRRVLRTQQLPKLQHPRSLTILNDGSLMDAGLQAQRWLQRLLNERGEV